MITEEKVWSYLDGQLNAPDRKAFEMAIVNDSNAKLLFEEISALHSSLKNAALLSPSASFTDKVMAGIQMAPAYTPPAKLSFKPFLIFALPSLLVIAFFAAVLAYQQEPLTYSLPLSLPGLKNLQLYFVVTDILLLAFFIDRLSEYRFNRKTFFAQ